MGKKIIAGIVITVVATISAVVAAIMIMTPRIEEEDMMSKEERHHIKEVEADLSEREEMDVEEVGNDEADSRADDDEDEAEGPKVEDIDIEIGNIFFKVLEHIQDMEESMTPAEVADFKKEFDMLNEEQKVENINHAVNLIGDNNFAALSAILFDLSEPKEIMETIFHDMLNRDEELKHETLKRLAEVKDHPLREDAAELLEEEN